MATVKAILSWCWEHKYVPLLVVAAVVGALLGGAFVKELRRPDKVVRKEIKAIDAGKRAAQDAIRVGTEAAVKSLEAQHRDSIAAFDTTQRAKLAVMRRDPKEMAAWLTRLSG